MGENTGTERNEPYKVIKLKHPVRYGKDGEKVLKELVMQDRPKAKTYKGINLQNMTGTDALTLLSRCFNQPIGLVEELDIEDMFQAQEVVNAFLPMTG